MNCILRTVFKHGGHRPCILLFYAAWDQAKFHQHKYELKGFTLFKAIQGFFLWTSEKKYWENTLSKIAGLIPPYGRFHSYSFENPTEFLLIYAIFYPKPCFFLCVCVKHFLLHCYLYGFKASTTHIGKKNISLVLEQHTVTTVFHYLHDTNTD